MFEYLGIKICGDDILWILLMISVDLV